MLHWLRRGIAGWRLDVAYAVPPQFWWQVLARVRAEFPDAIFIGEVIHGDYPAIAHAASLDSITQ
jgi:cyclomaltodextrinase / maltogenic alpha-amylase / neopullulanase